MNKSKSFKVKGYKKLRALAPKVYKVKGKVGLREEGLPIQLVGWSNWGHNRHRELGEHREHSHIPVTTFFGPTLHQKLRGFVLANTIVIVSLGDVRFTGRVISVDGDVFEVVVVHSLHSPFPAGSIVTVNIFQLNAIGVG